MNTYVHTSRFIYESRSHVKLDKNYYFSINNYRTFINKISKILIVYDTQDKI